MESGVDCFKWLVQQQRMTGDRRLCCSGILQNLTAGTLCPWPMTTSPATVISEVLWCTAIQTFVHQHWDFVLLSCVLIN